MALVKISDMTAAGALTGTESLEVVQGGATRRTTTGAVAGLVTSLDAADIGYDGTASGLVATDAQAAIDEIVDAATVLAAAPLVTRLGTTYRMLPADAGTYSRFTDTSAKTVTFHGDDAHVVPSEYHIRNAAASGLTLAVAGGFVINIPAGGTLVVPPHGTVTVKIVASKTADLFGVTVPSP